MRPTIRLVQPADAPQIAAIYAPFCKETSVSFEVDAPTPAVIRERIQRTVATFPWLVLDQDGTIGGYVYASQHRERAAYQWASDVTAYMAPECRGRGAGRALYTALLAALTLQGFFKAYAGIALPNPASVGLHTAMGFTLVGVYQHVGYKLGAWHDVAWYACALQPECNDPTPPRRLPEVLDTPAWDAALATGVALLYDVPRY